MPTGCVYPGEDHTKPGRMYPISVVVSKASRKTKSGETHSHFTAQIVSNTAGSAMVLWAAHASSIKAAIMKVVLRARADLGELEKELCSISEDCTEKEEQCPESSS